MRAVEKALRLGQAADELGTTRYILQRLCELGLIEGERTPGRHWRIPWAEVERLKTEGVPILPALISAENEQSAAPEPDGNIEDAQAESSDVIRAEDETKIVRNRLEKRRIERDLEETEDWFRARDKQQAGEETAARQRAEAEQAQQRRRKLIQQWTEYGLNCLPRYHVQESEIPAHRALQELLPSLDLDQPDHVTRRLVQAAIEKAYAPYKRKEEIKGAIEAARNSLPWAVLHDAKYAALKECAAEAIAAAVAKLRDGADSREMNAATIQAVQPIITEYSHITACERICVYGWQLSGATSEEREKANEAVRKRIAALPMGATPKQMEDEKRAALAPFEAAIASREKAAKMRRDAESKVDWKLGHVRTYIVELENDDEVTFDDGWDRITTIDKFKDRIRPILIERVLEDPNISDKRLEKELEDLVDEYWHEFVDEKDEDD